MTSTALLRALPRGPASQHSCRHAHLSSSLPSSLNSSSNAPPPPSTCFAAAGPSSGPLAFTRPAASGSRKLTSSAEPNPAWSDPSYLARYRNPVNHERPLARPPCSKHTSPPSTSAADCPISTATREDYRKREQERETPRSRRLEMERLWSGGEASPPIPLHSYRVSKSLAKPKHALLFPGSGSQYVGMGHFLQGYAGAKAVWDEAEEALEGFEAWRKGLGLENYEGEVGVLGRMLAEREGERKEETGLKEVVFDGPQVSFSLACVGVRKLTLQRQDELTRSSNAQPAILITSIAFLRTLEVRRFSAYLTGRTDLFAARLRFSCSHGRRLLPRPLFRRVQRSSRQRCHLLHRRCPPHSESSLARSPSPLLTNPSSAYTVSSPPTPSTSPPSPSLLLSTHPPLPAPRCQPSSSTLATRTRKSRRSSGPSRALLARRAAKARSRWRATTPRLRSYWRVVVRAS